MLLSVKFEMDGVGKTSSPSAALTPKVWLPRSLLTQLKEAAGFHRVTELRVLISNVEALGLQEEQLAARLRELVRSYNVEAVLRVLNNE